MRKTKSDYQFPWRTGNLFRLYIDGVRFFPAMLEAIHGARSFILLEMYLVQSSDITNRFITAFLEARQRGVQIYLLFDDFGSAKFTKEDRERLIQAGVHFALYNPVRYHKWNRNLFRTHRKLFVVDDKRVFVGGAGLTDDFFSPDNAHPPWRETMIEVRGPCVADWTDIFFRTWKHWSNIELPTARIEPVICGSSSGRVALSQFPAPMEIKRSFLKHVQGAEQRVWLSTAYFVPSWKILRALRKAARRGVDVRLLLPGPYTDNPPVRHAGRRFYSWLLRNKIRVFEYQPRFIHSKVALCDDWVSVGSSNIDRWGFRWNLEANQEIEDAVFAQEVALMFKTDFSEALEMGLPAWRKRSWWGKLLERFWGMVDRWLEKRNSVNDDTAPTKNLHDPKPDSPAIPPGLDK